jgi:ketosteroid isomerase-like protein
MSVSDRGTTHDGLPMRRSGDTSSVLRRQPEGAWIITRDANTLVPEPVMFPA